MKEQQTTIQVSKKNSDEIQAYCIKKGHGKGEFVNAVWQYLKPFINDIDIFTDGTPYLPMVEQSNQETSVAVSDAKDNLLAALQSIVEGLQPGKLIEHGMELGKMETKCNDLEKANTDISSRNEQLFAMLKAEQQRTIELQNTIRQVEKTKQAAIAELKRIQENQKYFGKLEIYIPE